MTPCVERGPAARRCAGMQNADTLMSPIKDDCAPEGRPDAGEGDNGLGIEGFGGLR